MPEKNIEDVVDDLVSLRNIEIEERAKDRKFRFIKFLLVGTAFMMIIFYQSWLFYDIFNNKETKPDGEYVALVRIEGAIGPGAPASAEVINPAMRKAFEDEDAKGVIIIINSPGGTPVQAGLMRDRIIALRKQYPDKRVAVIAEDMMTSGGYLIATGSKEIYSHPASLVGSIGVIMSGFGFDKVMSKFEIERRVFIAGNSKASMDPFQPLKEQDIKSAEQRLNDIHKYFISAVKESRGGKLKTEKDLFDGNYWTGQNAIKYGLIDGMKDLATLVEEFGAEQVEDYTPRVSFFSKLSKMSDRVSMSQFFNDMKVELR